MADEIATLALHLESNQFEKGLERCINKTETLGTASGKALASIAAIWGGGKIAGVFKESVSSASAAREDMAQFNHVMRNVTRDAKEMMDTLTSVDFGRTTRQAQQMLMNMTSMAKGMGMTDANALKLSGSLSQLSIDIGSFTAKDPADVMNAFSSAMMGFNQALRPYGIFLTEAILDAKILENAKNGLVFASEREARAFAILSEAQKQQADAIGDFAVESLAYMNQLRQAGAKIEQLKGSFGKGLIEPVTKALHGVNYLLDTMQKIDEPTMKFISRTAAMGAGVAGITATVFAFSEAMKIRNAILATGNAATMASTKAKVSDSTATAALAAVEKTFATSTAASTTAINAETAALTRNTAAKTANAAMSRQGRIDARLGIVRNVAATRGMSRTGQKLAMVQRLKKRDPGTYMMEDMLSGAMDVADIADIAPIRTRRTRRPSIPKFGESTRRTVSKKTRDEILEHVAGTGISGFLGRNLPTATKAAKGTSGMLTQVMSKIPVVGKAAGAIGGGPLTLAITALAGQYSMAKDWIAGTKRPFDNLANKTETFNDAIDVVSLGLTSGVRDFLGAIGIERLVVGIDQWWIGAGEIKKTSEKLDKALAESNKKIEKFLESHDKQNQAVAGRADIDRYLTNKDFESEANKTDHGKKTFLGFQIAELKIQEKELRQAGNLKEFKKLYEERIELESQRNEIEKRMNDEEEAKQKRLETQNWELRRSTEDMLFEFDMQELKNPQDQIGRLTQQFDLFMRRAAESTDKLQSLEWLQKAKELAERADKIETQLGEPVSLRHSTQSATNAIMGGTSAARELENRVFIETQKEELKEVKKGNNLLTQVIAVTKKLHTTVQNAQQPKTVVGGL